MTAAPERGLRPRLVPGVPGTGLWRVEAGDRRRSPESPAGGAAGALGGGARIARISGARMGGIEITIFFPGPQAHGLRGEPGTPGTSVVVVRWRRGIWSPVGRGLVGDGVGT